MKRFFCIPLIFLLLFSTGCAKSSLFSNFRPIEKLQLVHTIGFDIREDGLELSICGGEVEGQGLIRLSCIGNNISDCLDRLQNYSDRSELYFAHTRYVVVGEDYARQGLGDVMQYLESSEQLRSDLPLFVVKSGEAKDIVMDAGGEKKGAHDVLEAVIRDCDRQGIAFPFTCGDIGSFSAEYGSALACALTVSPTKDSNPTAEDEDMTPIAAGYAVIDYGTLTVFLSANASRAANLLLGELGTGTVTISAEGQPVSLRITESENTLQPVFGAAGTVTELGFALELQAESIETEQNHRLSNRQSEAALSRAVTEWMDELFLAFRSTECDFLGLGPRIAVSHPKGMTDGEIPWATLPMSAEVRCILQNSKEEAS